MECVNYQGLYQAAMRCKQGKSGSGQAQAYNSQLIDQLSTTLAALQSYSWRPGTMRCFIATNGVKPREIHAPDYADRVVHHWLIPRLTQLIEPKFIYHSCANREGKGTHFAVNQLQKMMRQQGAGGYYLQLDIFNFFYSIDRTILNQQLNRHLEQAEKKGKISRSEQRDYLWLIGQLLFQPITVHQQGRNDAIPYHKQWKNIPPDKGLPIGNLSSQFFANVYLNELDQFIKHQLKCCHYIRYVDDFILLSESRESLLQQKIAIEQFLMERLQLRLKPESVVAECRQGVDFLGYIIRPHYKLVRRRVVHNLKQKLAAFEQKWVRTTQQGVEINAAQFDQLRALLASYRGHFSHAQSWHIMEKIGRQFISLAYSRKTPGFESLRQQWCCFRRHYPGFFDHPGLLHLFAARGVSLPRNNLWGNHHFYELPLGLLRTALTHLRNSRQPWLWISEQGYSHNRLKQRQISKIFIPHHYSPPLKSQ
ncbi:MAG: reverse transcriptase [Gammaproteobacteria bacterium]|jgi:retron-type reverse transcriptase|nr:reverse transcriptase [Gammaproteobacteria bacterium]MBT4329028.1 reverse transcriptase [Gammaproteobacteria bacterium]MBT5634854.1 reverse transcriptase [Gammaproteobacteria bacterium]MBT6670136.1 reverse transcriptase [Gammaproteobacteria bacterium]